ncbi:MAG: ATPase [Betaproteobacteria bacterium RIFCSPLOWO2_02_FULL_65_24]|nr:MAG: ATPase [Betaproteobacteria bacterium RIFCSPLOWO2_02_FULL_65_24]OGA96018.1 MAG: ATPase [Betaproteobacteria bacterium RIFCSPLOWO2_12_FULL_66_14]
MIRRQLEAVLLASLRRFPVVGLVGARQVGKTTLGRAVADRVGGALYLDLERPSDAARLADPELYLELQAERLVVIDEIQRNPALFPVLRSLVDARRRNGRFLVLGSASPDLSRQASESLAGRIVYHELAPFTLDEIGSRGRPALMALWSRGGFPQSYLAASDAQSVEWREAFIDTHLQRDLPALGVRIPAASLRRFWEMLAHFHGQLWNASKIAASLGVSAPTAKHYLDTLQDTFMVRALVPFAPNLKKRLVKSPKIYLRDSGLLHALLRIGDVDRVLGHPVAGASWEGWVIEQALAAAGDRSGACFYRTAAGAEIDLVIERHDGQRLAFEIKLGSAPAPTRGFWSALSDLKPGAAFVVYPGKERYPLGHGVEALPASMLGDVLKS